ncbi:MAG: ABC transporter ATP-binding protein [Ktedonobacterales bacterium]|nr:ABC transporter ATP-binding protein [Ktedonobacterales bacterium]
MNEAITTNNLTKHYGARPVVEGVALHVQHGEIYAFLGLNGAGKTTTLRMLLGMVRPTAGTITMLGQPVGPETHALWGQVGYLVETPYAYPELTVRENLEIARRLHVVADPHAVQRTLEHVGLLPYADRRAGTLSLGNAQRVGLAKALLHSPKVLILDEPINGLDPAGVVEVRELLRGLAQAGITILLASHLLSEVARIATRVGILHQGRCVAEMDAATLHQHRQRWLVLDTLDRVATRQILDSAGILVDDAHDDGLVLRDAAALAHPERIARLLVEADQAVTKLSILEEDLESQFLRLVGVTAKESDDARTR